jgi:hypothetical protein
MKKLSACLLGLSEANAYPILFKYDVHFRRHQVTTNAGSVGRCPTQSTGTVFTLPSTAEWLI